MRYARSMVKGRYGQPAEMDPVPDGDTTAVSEVGCIYMRAWRSWVGIIAGALSCGSCDLFEGPALTLPLPIAPRRWRHAPSRGCHRPRPMIETLDDSSFDDAVVSVFSFSSRRAVASLQTRSLGFACPLLEGSAQGLYA